MDTVRSGSRRDCMGLPVTCAREDALRSFDQALMAQLTLRERAAVYLEQACRDSTFALAHCFSVRATASSVHQQLSGHKNLPPLQGCLSLLFMYILPTDDRGGCSLTCVAS